MKIPYRYYFALLLLGYCCTIAVAQKNDYMWPLGYAPNKSESRFFYNFSTDTPSVTIRPDSNSTGLYSSSFCDNEGNIRFFSNGLKIFDKNGNLVENGEGLNPTTVHWQNQLSYPGGQSGFFLENPGNPNILYFISLDYGPNPTDTTTFIGKNVLIATIDEGANNGAGKVTEKNKVLLTGTLMAPAACRHANGRDWWILTSDADKNKHYRVLLSPDGFSSPVTQNIGTKPNPIGDGNFLVGNCFSPRGNYYVDQNDAVGFSIFQFNRCTGMLSNEKRLDYPPPPPMYPYYYRHRQGSGAVFSPDEKLFYKTSTVLAGIFPGSPAGSWPYLFQFDLSAPVLAAAVDTINPIDSIDYFFPWNITSEQYFGAELGPDGRIYVVHEGVSYCTVQYPNVKGRGCKFVHDKPFFGVMIGSAIPSFPNYRLGPLDGSPCDTLGLNNVPVANFRVDDTLGAFSRYFYDLSHHEPDHWHWDFGDGHTSNEQSPLHTFPGPGVYGVCLTVSNQYGAHSECRTLYLGVSQAGGPPNQFAVRVLPNPFSDRILVELEPSMKQPVFKLYDQTGRLTLQTGLSAEKTKIDGSRLPPGVYYWQVTFISGETGNTGAKSGVLTKSEQ